MSSLRVHVDSPKVKYTEDSILAEYDYLTTKVTGTNPYNVSFGYWFLAYRFVNVWPSIVIRWFRKLRGCSSKLTWGYLSWVSCLSVGEATMDPRSLRLCSLIRWSSPGKPRMASSTQTGKFLFSIKYATLCVSFKNLILLFFFFNC